MGARQKLNSHHVLGALCVAGFLGLVTGSMAVFVIAGAVMIGASIYAGDVRPGGRRRRP